MSKALNSPTGRLLRNSRLFSMPPPLPQPQLEALTSAGVLRSSESATRPYPTRQAIATPKSSRHRGDWGLKRPLPQRSTNTSTPHLRINAIDNEMHITDFESAADHTQSLAKWQEMNIVMGPRRIRTGVTMPSGSGSKDRPQTVFDEQVDNTAFGDPLASISGETGHGLNTNHMEISAESAIRRYQMPETHVRWKTRGPWVAGMTEDEFQVYMKKWQSPRNKKEFSKFLEYVKIQEKIRDQVVRLREEGLYDPESEEWKAQLPALSRLEEGELDTYVRGLRDKHEHNSSDLSRLIQVFYDLPPLATSEAADNAMMRAISNIRTSGAPPVVHGSGGLSYIRTKAYMENHPLYGAQARHAPVEARVVRPKNLGGIPTDYAKVGIGGFVAVDTTPGGRGSFRQEARADTTQRDRNLDRAQLKLEGGAKIWVEPGQAWMDDAGRVLLDFGNSDKSAVEVKTGNIDPNRPSEVSSNDDFAKDIFSAGIPSRSPPGTKGNANYGTAMPDLRSLNRPAAFAFGEEAKQGRRDVEAGKQSSTSMIADLLKKHEDFKAR